MKERSQGRLCRVVTPRKSGPTTSPWPTLWQALHRVLKNVSG